MFLRIMFVLVSLCCSSQLLGAMAASLPRAVQLGGAVVAVAQAEAEDASPKDALDPDPEPGAKAVARQLLTALTSDGDLMGAERLLKAVDEGRGRLRKRRKMLKYLYPLLVGVLIAKSVVVPLVLKLLTALSSTSFVLSKIALATSGLLALKWIFSGPPDGNGGEPARQRTKLEIYHLPPGKTFGGGNHRGSHGNLAYDLAWSDSNVVANLDRYPHKYIPVGAGGGAVGGGGVGDDSDGGPYSDSAAVRHPHHSYNDVIDGKPFL